MIREERVYGRPGARDRKSRGRTETLAPKPRVLIVCEGKKTEPGYFNLFSIRPSIRELDIRGEAKNSLSLVEEAESIEASEGDFDEVWCVFDRDSFKPDNYDNALSKIKSKKRYFAAYSNEAFELWFVLHFEFLNSAIGRHQYIDKLTSLIGQKYQKNDPEIYRLIQKKGDEAQAMLRADKLLEMHSSEVPYSLRCPSTEVHLLVRKLRLWEKESVQP